MNNPFSFLTEVRAELTRVNWPTRKLLVRYTVLVIGISIAVAVFLGSLDFLFSFLVENFLLK
ncbi:MAG: preprotein translocase subunit SecE [Candidatus Moranbacteria bacterium]|nr:preprotein translocase subunit SecE [Candidatus Moranbacteria bacterium]